MAPGRGRGRRRCSHRPSHDGRFHHRNHSNSDPRASRLLLASSSSSSSSSHHHHPRPNENTREELASSSSLSQQQSRTSSKKRPRHPPLPSERRRPRNAPHTDNNSNNSNNTAADSIEAQLARQRLQRQQQQEIDQEQQTTDATTAPVEAPLPSTMGLYQYDAQRQAYFLPTPHEDHSYARKATTITTTTTTTDSSPNIPTESPTSARARSFPHLTFATDGSVWERKKIHCHQDDQEEGRDSEDDEKDSSSAAMLNMLFSANHDDDVIQSSSTPTPSSSNQQQSSPKIKRMISPSSRTCAWDWIFHRQATSFPPRTRLLTTWGVAADAHRRMRTMSVTRHWGPRREQIHRRQDGDYYSDLTCKIHKPPWIQTFDVWDSAASSSTQRIQHQSQSSRTPRRADLNSLQLQVTTVVENGYEIRSLLQHSSPNSSSICSSMDTKRCFRPSSYRPQSTRYFPMSRNLTGTATESPNTTNSGWILSTLSSDERETCFTIVSPSASASLAYQDSNNGSTTNTRPRLFPPPQGDENGTLEYSVTFQVPCNDVMDTGDGSGVFYLAASRGSPWCVSFDSRQVCRPIKIPKLPNSEVLCLERLSESASANQSPLFLMGHRNGKVTMYDPRNQPACSQLGDGSNHNGGSITSILSLGRNCERNTGDKSGISHEHLVLTRQQNLVGSPKGIAALWDIRRATQPVFEFCIPESLEPHARYTKRCSGMATDPFGITLLAPFVQDHDLGEIPCLGFWSLVSGELVGYRRLAQPTDHIPLSSKTSVSWVELNSQRTRPLEWNEDDSHIMTSPRHSFGLWYKCGQAPDAHTRPGELLPSSAGNIHQITI